MRDDERLFSFGLEFLVIALIAVAIFHSAFNSDFKKLERKKETIKSLSGDLENAKAKFAELTRPELLRPIVMQLYPSYRPVGTGRAARVLELE